MNEAECDVEAPLHAPGVRAAEPVRGVREPDGLEQRVDPPGRVAGRDAEQARLVEALATGRRRVDLDRWATTPIARRTRSGPLDVRPATVVPPSGTVSVVRPDRRQFKGSGRAANSVPGATANVTPSSATTPPDSAGEVATSIAG
jgi:hypothetical protein